MVNAVVLDAGPLARISHPRANPEIVAWLEGLLRSGVRVIVPEIADYEVRRELLGARKTVGVARLNQLKEVLEYLPINTQVMLRAPELWAEVRRRGLPTADPKELDGDVILAAQAEQAVAPVVTENVGRLSRLVEVRRWNEVQTR